MKKPLMFYIFSFVCMLAGAMIYFLFRNDVLFLKPIDSSLLPNKELETGFWTYFLLYNLSDLLWALSLMFFATALDWKLVKFVALVMGPLMEVLQYGHILPGTFDIIDLIIYLTISLIFLKLWTKRNQFSLRLSV